MLCAPTNRAPKLIINMTKEIHPLVINRPEKLCRVRGVESALGVPRFDDGEVVPNHFATIFAPSAPPVMFKMAVERLCTNGEPRGNTCATHDKLLYYGGKKDDMHVRSEQRVRSRYTYKTKSRSLVYRINHLEFFLMFRAREERS